jgi:antitoxin VapB
MTGRSQAVRIPAQYRFISKEVSIRRDPKSGDLILSQAPSWEEIFAMLDQEEWPEDWLRDREKETPPQRDDL